MRTLRFARGTLVVEDPGAEPVKFRAADYRRVLEEAKAEGVDVQDLAQDAPELPELKSNYTPRDYQSEALNAWDKSGRWGVIVLPTGAGKTIVAVKAIELTRASTLVVVPTIVLMEQWRQVLGDAFGIPVGGLGGGVDEVKPITVATYESASLRARSIGNRFGLLIFDEVHHLPAQGNTRMALGYTAPMRLGLTATLGDDPETVESLLETVGPVVYQKAVDDLAGTHLSDYTVRTIQVPLAPSERLEYERQFRVYRDFLQRRGIKIRGAADYLAFVRRSGVDPEARRALLARNSAMDVALNSSAKVDYLREVLRSNPDAKAIIFTRHNKLVYRISRMLLIPAITHQTAPEERRQILNAFRSGEYRRILTSQVLDEGIDVPDASLAVILSGTGSSRQFVQRLGRVLRKREGKEAVLVELVSTETAEARLSQRRKEQ